MSRRFIFILLLLTTSLANATESEQLVVQINRQVYINGAYLKYNIYLTNPGNPNANVSNVVYFDIVDAQNNSYLKWKSRIKCHNLTGQIILPETLNNGVYYLKAYTNVMRSYSLSQIGIAPFIVQRIYENPTDTLVFAKVPVINNNVLDLPVDIKIDSNKTHVTIQPGQNLLGANLFVSFTELSPFDTILNKTNALNTNSTFTNKDIKNAEFYTEYGDMAIAGRVIYSADSTPVANKIIYLATTNNNVNFIYTTTNASGQFCFLVDTVYDNKKIVLQIIDNNLIASQVIWQIDQNQYNWYNNVDKGKTNTDIIQKDYIYSLQKRELVHRIFNPDKNFDNKQLQTDSLPMIFGKPNFTVNTDDYEPLNNFRELCDNILTTVKYKTENDKIKIGIVSPRQETVYDNTLICIDGIPCNNYNYIAKLGSKDIKYVDIYNNTILYGNITFNGVVSIITFKKPKPADFLSNPYYIFNNQFYSNPAPSISVAQKPNINADAIWKSFTINNNPLKINIEHPHIGSEFNLKIQGIKPDGQILYYNKNLKIK